MISWEDEVVQSSDGGLEPAREAGRTGKVTYPKRTLDGFDVGG